MVGHEIMFQSVHVFKSDRVSLLNKGQMNYSAFCINYFY